MRQIKFRGVDVETGKFVYGDFIQSETHAYISKNFLDIDERSYVVKPDSVRQLVGFDKDGREVYEGDVVIDKYNFARSAQLTATLREDVDIGNWRGIPTERFWDEQRRYSTFTLKETKHETIPVATQD